MIGCFSPWQMCTPASPPTSATRNGSKYIDPTASTHLILPRRLRAQLQGFIKQGKFPNLVFHGLPGIGKTSAAINLCKVVDVDVFRVRADTDRGIDRVRQIMDFATTVAFSGGGKVVIMEEGNLLTREAQGALLSLIEECASNCGFIFTCNDLQKIIPALRSRCKKIDFTPNPVDDAECRPQCHGRMCDILDQEGVQYNSTAVMKLFRPVLPGLPGISTNCKVWLPTGALGNALADAAMIGIGASPPKAMKRTTPTLNALSTDPNSL